MEFVFRNKKKKLKTPWRIKNAHWWALLEHYWVPLRIEIGGAWARWSHEEPGDQLTCGLVGENPAWLDGRLTVWAHTLSLAKLTATLLGGFHCSHFIPGLPSRGTVGFGGWITLCGGGCPGDCRRSSGIPGLYPPHASSIPLPVVANRNVSWLWHLCPAGQRHSESRTTGLQWANRALSTYVKCGRVSVSCQHSGGEVLCLSFGSFTYQLWDLLPDISLSLSFSKWKKG